MKECSKSLTRRLHSPDFVRRFFVGDGLDVGGRPDPLALYAELFCRVTSIRTWDTEDGDAQRMETVQDTSFDFVHSSHCLEHLANPLEGLRNWLRILRPHGHLIVTVPDEDMYEQGVFPSTFNGDHKWTFTVNKSHSWSPRSLNVLDLVGDLGAEAELVRLERLTSTYRFGLPRYDQTLSPLTESGIEFVVRRRPEEELRAGGPHQGASQPSPEVRRHLNQYRKDLETLKESNIAGPPFDNSDPI